MAKKPEKPKVTFIRDSREKKGQGFTWRITKDCDGTLERKLDTGDYSIVGFEEKISVERKGSAGELIGNLFSPDRKRFLRELERLKSFKFAWIMCEFTLDDVENEIARIQKIRRMPRHNAYINMDSFLGCIASLSVQYGVHFIFAGQKKQVFNVRNKSMRYRNHAKDLTRKLLLKAYKYIEE